MSRCYAEFEPPLDGKAVIPMIVPSELDKAYIETLRNWTKTIHEHDRRSI